MVHTIYTIVYGLRFSVQISPGLASCSLSERFTHRLPSRFVLAAMRVCLQVAGKRWNGKYTPSLEASAHAIALITFPGSTCEN